MNAYEHALAGYDESHEKVLVEAIPLTIIEPTVWKKFHALRGGDKEISRLRALQLFPTAHELLALKKHHGRAEASLIELLRPQPNSRASGNRCRA